MSSIITHSDADVPGALPGGSSVVGDVPAAMESARFERAAQLDLETVRPQLHSRFAVLRGGEIVELELREVTQLPGHQAGRQECFSLIFRGCPTKPLEQGLHAMQQAALGEFVVFLVPIRSDAPDERWYESVFIRQLPGGV